MQRHFLRWLAASFTVWACLPSAAAVPVTAKGGMVSSINPLATRAGVHALETGGNAVDAAAAVALTLGVVDGHNSGVGAGCFMLIHRADGEIVALDGRETAPAAATRDLFVVDGKGDTDKSQTGALASGIPGSLAVYDAAVREYGCKGLRDALLPAAAIAEAGFAIDAHYAERNRVEGENLARFPASKAIFLHANGSPRQADEILKQPDLARSYRAIAAEGADWFYRGPFARAAARWMAENGGIITAADFAGYTIRRREPVRTTYRGYEVVSFPPPSSGGLHVVQILNILENFDVPRLAPADRVHVMAEAMKLAFADRAYWLGDPDFTRVPRGLADKAYARQLAGRISLEHSLGEIAHGTPDDAETNVFGKHTTHFCTADAEGNWVSCTTTLNTSFGSKVVVPGTGILLNDQMDDFSIQPGVPNAFGLVGGDANAVAAGKRPLSSMSPTLVLKAGKPVLELGAAGGPTIITQTVINLVGVLDLGLPVDEALAQPRFHHQWTPDELLVEERMPPEIVASLKAQGHTVKTTAAIGASQGLGTPPDGQGLTGASEPRAMGLALGFDAPAPFK